MDREEITLQYLNLNTGEIRSCPQGLYKARRMLSISLGMDSGLDETGWVIQERTFDGIQYFEELFFSAGRLSQESFQEMERCLELFIQALEQDLIGADDFR